jgi:hypothetical protein
MNQRATVIVALLALQASVVALGVVSVYSGLHAEPFGHHKPVTTAYADGPALVADGPPQTFHVGAAPKLYVDIDYADLTIDTGNPAQMEVSLRSSDGIFDDKRDIVARAVGDTIHISKRGDEGMSSGDDRMVTVIVPPGTEVTVASGGDIKATGLQAAASISSVGRGSVAIEDFDGPRLRVSSTHGSILLQKVTATHLDVTSSDDHIDGSALQVRDGTISADDHVTLGFATGTNTLVNALTNDGKIDVSGFPDGASLSSTSNDDNASQTVRVGSGTGHLEVHSNDGNITLTQEGG